MEGNGLKEVCAAFVTAAGLAMYVGVKARTHYHTLLLCIYFLIAYIYSTNTFIVLLRTKYYASFLIIYFS